VIEDLQRSVDEYIAAIRSSHESDVDRRTNPYWDDRQILMIGVDVTEVTNYGNKEQWKDKPREFQNLERAYTALESEFRSSTR